MRNINRSKRSKSSTDRRNDKKESDENTQCIELFQYLLYNGRYDSPINAKIDAIIYVKIEEIRISSHIVWLINRESR